MRRGRDQAPTPNAPGAAITIGIVPATPPAIWAPASTQGLIDQISRGHIDDDDVAAIMPGLRREQDAIKADLVAEEPVSNIVILEAAGD